MVRYLLLGLIQGITEFLPVSSSAHLLLAQRWLGLGEPGPLLVAFAHLGTLGAVLLWFFRDLAGLAQGLWRGNPEARGYWGALGLGTLPLVLAAGVARGRLDQVFRTEWVPFFLLANGLFLVGVGRTPSPLPCRTLGLREALAVGLAQMLAILPGLSRSGLTLATGLRLGLEGKEVFRFSFLLGIPAIVGGALLAAWEGSAGVESWAGLSLTAGAAFLSGLFALALLARAVRRRALWPFGLYCLLLGLLALSWK